MGENTSENLQKLRRLTDKYSNPNEMEAEFWNTHSDDASYINEDILDAILEVFISTKANLRIGNKTMMTNGNPHMTNRKSHLETVKVVAENIAKRLFLNVKLTGIIALFHDIGHTFNGHQGERMMSIISQNYGFGYICHNALGVEILMRERVIEKIIKKVNKKNPKISETDVIDGIIKIFDGILCHNGETTDCEVVPKYGKKTHADFWKDFENCFIYEKYDRTVCPITPEAAIVKFSDIISYVASDFLDGYRAGVLNGISEKYLEVFESFGITIHDINKCRNKDRKDFIANKIKEVLADDLVKHSFGKRSISMSPEMAKAMYQLRNVNYNEVVKKCARPLEQTILPVAVNRLNRIFAESIIQQGLLKNLLANTSNRNPEYNPYEISSSNEKSKSYLRKLEHFIRDMSESENDLHYEIIRKSVEVSIDEEIKIALAMLEPSKCTPQLSKKIKSLNESSDELNVKWNRIKRFKRDIENIGINDFNIDKYKKQIMSEIMMTVSKSEELFMNRLNQMYPNASDTFLPEKYIELYETERLVTFEEILAMSLASKYIRGSSDDYILDMLKAFEIIDDETINKYRHYDPNTISKSLEAVMAIQAEERGNS